MPEPSSVAATDTLSTSPSPSVEPAAGSGDAERRRSRVGHGEARAPDGAIADCIDADHDSVCAPEESGAAGRAVARPARGSRHGRATPSTWTAIEAVPLGASENASSTGGRASAAIGPGVTTPTDGRRAVDADRERKCRPPTSPLTSAPPTAPWWTPSPSAAADRQSRACPHGDAPVDTAIPCAARTSPSEMPSLASQTPRLRTRCRRPRRWRRRRRDARRRRAGCHRPPTPRPGGFASETVTSIRTSVT